MMFSVQIECDVLNQGFDCDFLGSTFHQGLRFTTGMPGRLGGVYYGDAWEARGCSLVERAKKP